MLTSAAMKPQTFVYAAPATLEETLELLAAHGEAAKVLAGGQSLVPMMALRLARPGVLVDVNRVAGLAELSVAGGELRVGATVRHHAFERPVVAGPLGELLARAAGHIGHLPIRLRGTMVGSLAHADPNAEWPLVALAAGAELDLASAGGRRTVPAEDFFDYPFSTALRPAELIAAVRFPLLGSGARVGFAEQAPTAGAFLQCGVCAVVEVVDGVVAGARLAAAGVAGRPVRLPAAEAALTGGRLGADLAVAAAAAAATEVSGSDYLRQLVAVLTEDVLRQCN